MKFSESKIGRIFACRLDYDSDLLDSLKRFAEENQVAAGFFVAIGALKRAKLSFYDQTDKKYVDIVLNKPLEIASCIGSIAKMKGETVIHAHLSASDVQGNAYGGHLMSGTTVFAGEIFIEELTVSLEREHDPLTGLNLFRMQG